MNDKPKRRQGFAVMNQEERKKISSLGGKSVKSENRAFSKDHKLASSAGKTGMQRRYADKASDDEA